MVGGNIPGLIAMPVMATGTKTTTTIIINHFLITLVNDTVKVGFQIHGKIKKVDLGHGFLIVIQLEQNHWCGTKEIKDTGIGIHMIMKDIHGEHNDGMVTTDVVGGGGVGGGVGGHTKILIGTRIGLDPV